MIFQVESTRLLLCSIETQSKWVIGFDTYKLLSKIWETWNQCVTAVDLVSITRQKITEETTLRVSLHQKKVRPKDSVTDYLFILIGCCNPQGTFQKSHWRHLPSSASKLHYILMLYAWIFSIIVEEGNLRLKFEYDVKIQFILSHVKWTTFDEAL